MKKTMKRQYFATVKEMKKQSQKVNLRNVLRVGVFIFDEDHININEKEKLFVIIKNSRNFLIKPHVQ